MAPCTNTAGVNKKLNECHTVVSNIWSAYFWNWKTGWGCGCQWILACSTSSLTCVSRAIYQEIFKVKSELTNSCKKLIQIRQDSEGSKSTSNLTWITLFDCVWAGCGGPILAGIVGVLDVWAVLVNASATCAGVENVSYTSISLSDYQRTAYVVRLTLT